MATQSRRNSRSADGWGATPQAGVNPLVDLAAAQLALWRGSADMSRALIRAQQDQILQLWRLQTISPQGDGAEAPESHAWSVAPVLASLGVAGRFGETLLRMQQEALDALRPRGP